MPFSARRAALLVALELLAFASTAKTQPKERGTDAPVDPDVAVTPAEPSPWLFEANLGVPKLKSDKFSLAVDALVGYDFGSWALDGQFATSSVAANAPNESFSSTSRTLFQAGASRPFSPTYAGRVELQQKTYSTTYISTGDAATFNSETSSIIRLTGLAVGAWQIAPKLSSELRLGFGYQSEAYSMASDQAASFSTSSSLRIRGQGAARYQLVPNEWAIRTTLGVDVFKLRRSSIFDSTSTDNVDPNAVSSQSGLEIAARGFLDWDGMTIVGLTPELMIGVDYSKIGDATAFVPLVGLGLVESSNM